MQKYYICTTGIAKGPFLLEDLYEIEIDEQDLIWGSKWRKAKYAYEIRELKKHFNKDWTQKNDGKNWLAGIMQGSTFIVSFITILFALAVYFLFFV
jgi:hypothetical protein